MLSVQGRVTRTALAKSPTISQWIQDASKENEEEQVLDIPFTLKELRLALDGTTYDFESWDRTVACASYLGVSISPECIRAAQLFTIECIRAGGMNPAHFHEASLFSYVLSSHDSRFHPFDVRTLELLYWDVVTSHTNLEDMFKGHVGQDVYEAAVRDTRRLRESITTPQMTKMTSVM